MGTRITTAPGGHYDSTGQRFTGGERVRFASRGYVLGTVASLDSAGVWIVRPDRPRACFCHRGETLTIVGGCDG